MNTPAAFWSNQEFGGPIFILVALVELALKGYGMWFAARNEQKVWYVALLVVNSLGILPLIYLLFFRPKAGTASAAKKSSSRKKK